MGQTDTSMWGWGMRGDKPKTLHTGVAHGHKVVKPGGGGGQGEGKREIISNTINNKNALKKINPVDSGRKTNSHFQARGLPGH